jgi:hypothetical protein
VVIDLLPVPLIGAVAEAAVAAQVPLVNTFYPTPELRALPRGAREGRILRLSSAWIRGSTCCCWATRPGASIE